ncbi:MAG: hypothetical protein QXS68_04140 [Candidatus Methanomethylicaceae archaeon]
MPSRLPFREEQYKMITLWLKGIEIGGTFHIALLGPKGTGKTATIMKAFKDKGIEDYYYVRCRNTEYLTFLELTKVVLGRQKAGLGLLPFDEVVPKIENKIVILDGADSFILRGDTELLYLFSRHSVNLAIISERFRLIEMIKDPGVISRLLPMKVLFNEYNATELRTILLQRIEDALGDASYFEESALNLMVANAKLSGDARYLMLLLKRSLIEASESDKVTEEHVRRADNKLQFIKMKREIQELSQQEKLLLLCATQFEKLDDVFEAYNYAAPKVGLRNITKRRLESSLSELIWRGFFILDEDAQSNQKIVFDSPEIKDKLREFMSMSFEKEKLFDTS